MQAVVEHVMALVELAPLRDALVGTPGECMLARLSRNPASCHELPRSCDVSCITLMCNLALAAVWQGSSNACSEHPQASRA